MADDVTCNLCGGTDFFKEAGHYYCTECQTQSQDIREHVFSVPEETAAAAARTTSSKRIRTEKKVEDQLTSWECYNYIIFGLANELIQLGADTKLKQNVRILWFKYLRMLEVISDKPSAHPKLAAVNTQVDAQIVYGRKARKRRSSRTPSPSSISDVSTLDAPSLRREKSKQRRSMVLAQYDEYSNTMQSEDVSLHNQSLISLKTASDSSKEREKYLRYNLNAKKELLKIMTKNHLKSHCRDVDSILDCHKLSYRSFSSKYTQSADVLSRNKVYALIYLGLLINKDKMQLGDLLRFIREGSLSYHVVSHFFPEEFANRNLNIKNWNKGNTILSHYGIRKVALKIARQLGITKYIPRQNLKDLCIRYCSELNLPNEVWGFTLNLMSRALPQMRVREKSIIIPNYEGRVMSMIMFVIKVFFGLDDVTENKFSAHAKSINDDLLLEYKMFVWEDWTYYISYRKLVLMQHHFPTRYLHDNESVYNSDAFINFVTQQNSKHEEEESLTREAEVLKQLLERLADRQSLPKESVHFTSSLTPFQDHIRTLLNSTIPKENNYLTDILKLNFKNDSFSFLRNHLFFLEELHKDFKIGIKHRGAQNNIKMITIPNNKVKRESWRNDAKKTVIVQFSDDLLNNSRRPNLNHMHKVAKLTENIEETNTKQILKNFEQRHMKSYKKNLRKLMRTYEKQKLEGTQTVLNDSAATASTAASQFDLTLKSSSTQVNETKTVEFETRGSQRAEPPTLIHYNPYERYWLKSLNVSNINKEDFQEFIATFPESFKLLLNECARITEQQPKDLFEEFTDVEIYLCYVAKFTYTDQYKDKIINSDLKRLIQKATQNW